ncbi:MAG: adenylyl-sulfate kinase [Nitrospiraceae bacterium]|nr:adenylyl-sulfate kinase [Nitrospiraceae bacterium]
MGFVIWITGLPGSGKSSVAEELKKKLPELVILRMDEMRKFATPAPSYSEAERDVIYGSLVFAARQISSLGHGVIIDATGNLRRWRELARRTIPNFAEVYLYCPVELCMERERGRAGAHSAPAGIYDKAKQGWPVPGVNVPYEEPENPELKIDTGRLPVEEAAALAEDLIKKLSDGPA